MVAERKNWNFQDLVYHQVPTTCISQFFYTADPGSGKFRDLPIVSQWEKLKSIKTRQICSTRSRPSSVRLLLITPEQFCICDPLKGQLRSYNDVIRTQYVFAYNFWLDGDRRIGWVPKCFSRLNASNHLQHGPLLEPKSKSKGNFAALTTGHPTSRSHIDLSNSCRISSDASGREEHFDTCLMSLSHSNQKLSKETYQT